MREHEFFYTPETSPKPERRPDLPPGAFTIAKESLQRSFAESIKSELLELRRTVPSSRSPSLANAELFSRLFDLVRASETAGYLAAVGPNLTLDERAAERGKIPAGLMPAVDGFLETYERLNSEIDDYLQKNPPEMAFKGLLKREPQGPIIQERVFNAVVWRFADRQDFQDFYKAVGGRGRVAQIGGTVWSDYFEIGRTMVALMVFPNSEPDTRIITHEARHVVNKVVHAQLMNEVEPVTARGNEENFFDYVHQIWDEALKDELVAFIYEYYENTTLWKGGLSGRLRVLKRFDKPGGSYDYPAITERSAKARHNELFPGSSAFGQSYAASRLAYQATTVGIIDRLNQFFGAVHTHDANEARLSTLRILEFFPLRQWPDLLDRADTVMASLRPDKEAEGQMRTEAQAWLDGLETRLAPLDEKGRRQLPEPAEKLIEHGRTLLDQERSDQIKINPAEKIALTTALAGLKSIERKLQAALAHFNAARLKEYKSIRETVGGQETLEQHDGAALLPLAVASVSRLMTGLRAEALQALQEKLRVRQELEALLRQVSTQQPK